MTVVHDGYVASWLLRSAKIGLDCIECGTQWSSVRAYDLPEETCQLDSILCRC